MLPNGNYLLTEALSGHALEVNPEGQTVWRWVHERYDDTRTASVTEATRYELTPEDVAAWPCAN